jgi:signal recognition particle subunit SRP54
MDQDFTLDDFRKHLDQIQQAGLKNMLARLPGTAETVREGEDPDVALERVRRMLDAMTTEERADPARIDAAARQRIGAAAGTEPAEVERFLSRFAEIRDRLRRMANMSFWERLQLVLGSPFKRFRPPPGH